MEKILNLISEILDASGISYEFGEWTQEVTYPYFVGSYDENSFRDEDGCTSGIFTIDGWSRNGKYPLVVKREIIKKLFKDFKAVKNEAAFYIIYQSASFVPSGEADLEHIVITLSTEMWEGE